MPVFDYTWMDDAPPYPDPVAHRTMAQLTIRIGDTVATEVYDRYLKEFRGHVFVPLSQVAEWAVLHWWRLLHEPAQASGPQRPGFAARHDLSQAGFGFALPRLSLRPLGEFVRAVVVRSNPRRAALEFRGHGEALLRRDKFEFAQHKRTHVLLHLRDSRRIYAFPVEWPNHPGEGHFHLAYVRWLTPDGQQLPGPRALLLDSKEVSSVEFPAAKFPKGARKWLAHQFSRLRKPKPNG